MPAWQANRTPSNKAGLKRLLPEEGRVGSDPIELLGCWRQETAPVVNEHVRTW